MRDQSQDRLGPHGMAAGLAAVVADDRARRVHRAGRALPEARHQKGTGMMRLILAAALVAASAGAAQAQWYYDNPYNLPPSIGPSYYERDAQLRAETQETVDRMMQQ